MLERVVIALLLLTVGFVAYRLFKRYHIHKATANSLLDPILHHLQPGIPVIVYFTTPGCIPCRTQQQPALHRLQDELGNGIQVVTIDAAENLDAASRWGVFSAPTTFVLDSTRQVRHINHGVADTAALKRQLDTLRATIDWQQPTTRKAS